MSLSRLRMGDVAEVLVPHRTPRQDRYKAQNRIGDEFLFDLKRITARKAALARMAVSRGHHLRVVKSGKLEWRWHTADPCMIHVECEKCHDGVYLWVRGDCRYAPIAENGQQLWECGECMFSDWPLDLSKRYGALAWGRKYECMAVDFVRDGLNGTPYLPAEKWPGRREMLRSGQFKSVDEANKLMREFYALGTEYRTIPAAEVQKQLTAGLPLFEGRSP